MQNYNVLQPTSLISADRQTINNNFESVASNFSGTFFPTQNLVDNMLCYRTDLKKMYQYDKARQQWNLVYDMSNGNCHVAEATNAQKATADANGNNIATTYLKNSNIITSIMNVIYPVGSIYITATNTNPQSFLGGTWQQIASGRTLVGAGGGYNAGATGGSESQNVTLSTANIPSHTHTITDNAGGHIHTGTATTSTMKNHYHGAGNYNIGTNNGTFFAISTEKNFTMPTDGGSIWWNGSNNGGSFTAAKTLRGEQTTSLAVEDTGTIGSHSHTLDIKTAGAHNHTVNATGSGSAFNVNHMQPYLVVYYWQRIG